MEYLMFIVVVFAFWSIFRGRIKPEARRSCRKIGELYNPSRSDWQIEAKMVH